MMTADFTEDKTADYEDIINSGVRLALYYGDKDFITNSHGGERSLRKRNFTNEFYDIKFTFDAFNIKKCKT